MAKDVELPSYAKRGDAGFDLRAAQSMTIQAGETAIVPTGLRFAIPDGHVGLIWDRSGLAANHSMNLYFGVKTNFLSFIFIPSHIWAIVL